MDDMDAVSEELGGLRSHFSGDFAKYRWANLTRPDAVGDEILQLYVEAISRMRENPNLPPLFRSIFNNAFLPYGDPETLRAFLNAIAEFDYAKSEPLGDAFEYLLSSLGSQGDAGQFLTPRHVIDFIVAVIDPKKYERVLDPACGTAGFLISAYRHIQAANLDADGVTTLEPNDKQRLADNFSGYDISPDMVRLSLVNMYLHGLLQPRIHEYDTLTNEDRWNELADVILANPPFMSPKGGIKPHERFTIQSKRSEVLFVDYIADHLTPRGRAGIIVPEGIVFQSQNAHRSLREKLVDEFLVAVVSLPAGVFKPYSGVKTSILILDRALSPRTDSIAFFKVENDGFELGDQRRPIDANDLPQAQAELTEYLNRLRNRDPLGGFKSSLGLIVKKARIAADGEYFLVGDRYRASPRIVKSKWPVVALRDICEEILSGGTPSRSVEAYWTGNIPWITSADIVDIKTANPRRHITEQAIEESATNLIKKGNVIVSTRVGLGKLFRNDFDVCISQDSQGLILTDKVNSDYLVYVLRNEVAKFKEISQGSTIQGVTKKQLAELQIPLPPLEVQREIVAEIAGYQRVIDGARAVVENWRPRVAVDPAWPLVKLGDKDIFDIVSGGTPKTSVGEYWDGGVPWITLADLPPDNAITEISATERTISPKGLRKSAAKMIPVNSVVVSSRATIGRIGINRIPLSTNQGFKNVVIQDHAQALSEYVALALIDLVPTMQAQASGATYKEITKTKFGQLEIPLPPLETQRAIAAELDAERALVDANRELIRRFEAKIEAAAGRVWGG